MWFPGLVAAVAVLLATPSLAQNSTTNSTVPDVGQSTFVSPDGTLMFGLTTVADSSDVYVAIQVPVGITWGAIGLGSNNMAGSLIMMIYTNAAGNNVTFSPRIAYGNYEPVHFPDMQYEILSGTGISNGMMAFNMRCYQSCRNWPNGYIDITGQSQKAIFAVGPPGSVNSNDPAAPLKFHQDYGTFTIDMQRTDGSGEPVLSVNSQNEGVTMGLYHEGKSDYEAAFHAVFMVFCFVGLMPFGVLVLRVGNWVRWHALNQGLALFGVIIGAILGIMTSFRYQRSRGFNTPHQIIGLVLFAFVMIQFVIGFLNHRGFKRTQQPTKLRHPHVWLGRVVILLGVANAFVGFPFALNPHYDYILVALILLVFPFCIAVFFGKRWISRRCTRIAGQGSRGYDTEPWRNADPPPAYEAPPPQQVGLTDLNTQGRKERGYHGLNHGLGVEVAPRELV